MSSINLCRFSWQFYFLTQCSKFMSNHLIKWIFIFYWSNNITCSDYNKYNLIKCTQKILWFFISFPIFSLYHFVASCKVFIFIYDHLNSYMLYLLKINTTLLKSLEKNINYYVMNIFVSKRLFSLDKVFYQLILIYY